jgi:hypothetical protein
MLRTHYQIFERLFQISICMLFYTVSFLHVTGLLQSPSLG